MFIADRVETNTSELVKYTKSTILRVLNKLENEDIIYCYGSNINDPKRKILLKQLKNSLKGS